MHVRASRCSAERTVAPRLLPRNWCCGSLCFPAKPFAGTVEPTNRRFESPQVVRTKSKHAPPTHSGWRRWCLRLPDRQPPTWVHVTGLTFGLNAAIETGAGVVAPDVEELPQHSVSVLASIPTMLQSPLGRRIMERVNTLVSAGGPPPRPVVRWPRCQYLRPAGDVRPGLRVRTRRGETLLGRCCEGPGPSWPKGQLGDLLVRGPGVMAGWWNRQRDTRAAWHG